MKFSQAFLFSITLFLVSCGDSEELKKISDSLKKSNLQLQEKQELLSKQISKLNYSTGILAKEYVQIDQRVANLNKTANNLEKSIINLHQRELALKEIYSTFIDKIEVLDGLYKKEANFIVKGPDGKTKMFNQIPSSAICEAEFITEGQNSSTSGRFNCTIQTRGNWIVNGSSYELNKATVNCAFWFSDKNRRPYCEFIKSITYTNTRGEFVTATRNLSLRILNSNKEPYFQATRKEKEGRVYTSIEKGTKCYILLDKPIDLRLSN